MNGIIIRANEKGYYAKISNHHMRTKALSLEAKGMLNTLLGLPENWKFSIDGLVQMSSNGRASVRSILKELTAFGYVRILRVRNPKGQLASVFYIIENPEQAASEALVQPGVVSEGEIDDKGNCIVIRATSNRRYSKISTYHTFDKSLSWGAKGMLGNMLTLPSDWKYSVDGLVRMSSNGRVSVRSILKELTELGYLHIDRVRNEKGQLTSIFRISEKPDAVASTKCENRTWSAKAHSGTENAAASSKCENRTWMETPRNRASEMPVSSTCENRTWVETPKISTASTASPSAEIHPWFPTGGSPNAVCRTQLNIKTNNENIDINNNIYTSSVDLSSVSSEDQINVQDPIDQRSEDSVKERIEYDRLLQRFPADLIAYIYSLIERVYRTDRRQMRISGVLRSVESIRRQLDALNYDLLCYVLDCYKQITSPIRNLDAYLLTALFNAPSTYSIYSAQTSKYAPVAHERSFGSFDTDEFFAIAERRSLEMFDEAIHRAGA